MNKKIKGIMILISILFISGISTDFLTGTVNNYGDGTKTVGEVWTGYSDWNLYMREASPTITKAYASTYGEYLIDMSATFQAQNTAPIWYGLVHPSTGRYYETYQRNIKVVQKISGIWYEIPSQISSSTKCFDNLGNPTTCSATHDKIKFLRLYAIANITGSNPEIKIFYPFAFLNSLNYEYKFEYNSTTGDYNQYNVSSVNYNDKNADYSPIINYNATTRKVVANNNFILDFDANWQLDQLSAGNVTSGVIDEGDIFKAYGGTMEINGLSSSNDVNASCVLEMEIDDANVMEQGSGTGALVLQVMPNMVMHSITSYVGDISPNNLLVEFERDSVGTCFGMCSSPCSIELTPPTISNAYSNLTNSFFDYNKTLSYNSTATNFGYSRDSGVAIANSNGEPAGGWIPSPFVGIIKSGPKYKSQGYFVLECQSTIDPNTNRYHSYNYEYAPNGFSENTNWIGYIGLYQVYQNGYSNTHGFSTRELGETILQNEPNGGKIRALLSFASYCTPTSYTGQCDSEDVYKWSGLSCLSDNNLGYTDNCGTNHACALCSSCTDSGTYFSCDGTCIPKSTNSITCYNGNLKIVDGCGTAYENCTYGCISGNCLTNNIVNLQTYVNDPVNSTVVGGATVNIHGLSTGFDKNITTDYNGLATFQVPASYSYSVYASKTDYITGCNNPSTGATVNGNYCTLTVPLSYSNKDSFDIYPTGTTSNYTKATFTTKFGPDNIPNVTVSLYNNGILIASQVTDYSGQTAFIWSNYNYTNLTAYANAVGYSSSLQFITLIPLKNNNIIIQLISQPSFTIFGGFTGENANTIYAQLFSLSDLPMNIYSTKSGKIILNRVDFTVKGCVDWPFCQQKKLYWANCLSCRNCTKDSINVVRYTLNSSDLGVAITGKIDEIINNIIGIQDTKTMDEMKGFIAEHKCQMQKNDNSTGLKLFGNNMYAMMCIVQEGANYILYKFDIMSGTLTLPTMLLNGVYDPIKGLIEALNQRNQDVYTEDIIFQCNNEAIANAIAEGTKFTIQYGSYQKTGTYVEIISDPALKDIVRTGQPPFVLPNGDNYYNYINNFVGTGIAYDKQDRSMYIGEYRINVGNNNLGNSKKYPDAVTRNRIFGDIVSDLQAGQYVSSEIKYSDMQSNTPPKESGKIDQPTLFEVTDYVRADFYPDDGGPKQTTFYRIITDDTNLSVSEIFMQNILWILFIVVFIVPSMCMVYLTLRKK